MVSASNLREYVIWDWKALGKSGMALRAFAVMEVGAIHAKNVPTFAPHHPKILFEIVPGMVGLGEQQQAVPTFVSNGAR